MSVTDFNLWAAELARDEEVTVANCRCGHPEFQHQHYRAGSDCVVCGCMNYQPPLNVSVTVTIGWILILALIAVFWAGAAWIVVSIIQWLSS